MTLHTCGCTNVNERSFKQGENNIDLTVDSCDLARIFSLIVVRHAKINLHNSTVRSVRAKSEKYGSQ